MKKLVMGISFVIAAFLLVSGCNQNGTDNSENEDEPTGSVSEIDGTYSGDGQTLVLDRGSMKTYASTATNSARAAKSDYGEGQAVYNFTVDESAKTMEVQLSKLFWETDQTAVDYDSYVQKEKAKYLELKNGLSETLTKSTAYQAILTTLDSMSSVSGTVKNYGTEKVDPLIKEKLGTYLENQEKILDDYLQKKYDAKIVFGYTLSEENLTLAQKFQGDLTDASADFATATDADYPAKLNDYENLIPFSIKIDDMEFVGVPQISENGETLTASLYSYMDLQDENALASKVAELMTYLSDKTSDVTKNTEFMAEVLSGSTDTISAWIDQALASLTFSADLTLDKETPKVTLTTSVDFEPALCGGVKLEKGTVLELNYNPILSKTWEKVD